MNFNFDFFEEESSIEENKGHPSLDPDDFIFSRMNENMNQDFNELNISNQNYNFPVPSQKNENYFLTFLNPNITQNNQEEKENESKNTPSIYLKETVEINNEKKENEQIVNNNRIDKKEIFKTGDQLENKSTATFTPEEKKASIEEILKKYKGKIQIRTDYLKKKYKVFLVQYAKAYLNSKLIKEGLDKTFGTFSLPNSKAFTGNVKDSINHEFLRFSVKDIFTLGKNLPTGGSLQEKNERLIKAIFDRNSNNINLLKIKSFLNLSLENMIQKFEESKVYEKFSEDEEVKYLDYYFQKEKRGEHSLTKKGGYLKYLKEINRKI